MTQRLPSDGWPAGPLVTEGQSMTGSGSVLWTSRRYCDVSQAFRLPLMCFIQTECGSVHAVLSSRVDRPFGDE